MKNKNIKIIIGIIIGVVLSGVTSYAVAKTLIDSKDVIYTDTYKLGAENVQDAIDGTCSKINTRLSEIENHLYTVKNITGSVTFTSSTNLSYTGVSIQLPTQSYCSITVMAVYSNSIPVFLNMSKSSTKINEFGDYIGAFQETPSSFTRNHLSLTYSLYTENYTNYYIWAQYNGASTNQIRYKGFCATKYK